jgi:hypothetical protein
MNNKDIELDITPASSVDDDMRKEILWEKREEQLIEKWIDDCKNRSLKHSKKAKEYKIKYSCVGLPSILIPIVLGGLSPVIKCDTFEYGLVLMFAGIFSGIGMFFNFGKKNVEHNTCSNMYFKLVNEVEAELSKPKKHRVACDVYMEKVKNEYNSLVIASPDL